MNLPLSQQAALTALTSEDFDRVSALARSIWLEHYAGFLDRRLVEYILSGRFTPESLQGYVQASDRWFEILKLQGEPVGYLSYALRRL